MKKVLFACDGNNFPEGAFRFIQLLREHEMINVKGLFFASIDFEAMIHASYIPIAAPYVQLKEDEAITIAGSKHRFKTLCRSFNIHSQADDTMRDWDTDKFVKESRFADMVVISQSVLLYTL